MSGPQRDPICVRARIEGRVQGVSYRAWTVQEASSKGLSGWVRNRTDGSVEALFCGEASAVAAMVAACRVGPPNAQVAHVVTESAMAPDGLSFRQLPTF